MGAANYYFAEDEVTYQGNLYLPRLVLGSAVKYTQALQLEPVTVMLQNITLETAALLNAQRSDLQGAAAVLERLFLAANEAVTLFSGTIATIQIDQQNAALTLAGDLDPTATQVPVRKYSALCVWDFKDSNCGYTDGVDPADPSTGSPFTSCPKDFASCQARGRQQRFSGFIHISRDLTLSIEGQTPDANAPQTIPAVLPQPWEQV